MPDSIPPEPRPPLRVLVVDDDADCAFVIATLLRLAGHGVHTARNGWEALQVARQVRPDVVLLDLGLPGMSGYELAGLMKKHPAHPPLLIALSGQGREEARRRCRDAGIDLHLLKPVEADSLLEVMARRSHLVGAASPLGEKAPGHGSPATPVARRRPPAGSGPTPWLHRC
jgi:CheY-like chemotaxis protein